MKQCINKTSLCDVRKRRMMCLVIAIFGLAVYITSFSGQFIWDDAMLIRDNPLIRSFEGVLKFFSADIGAGAGGRFGFYRPVQMFTYMIDYHLWGLQPGGYHLFNALLHVGVSLCVFWLALLLTENAVLAFVAGLLYTVHPVHSDAVAYISGRADSLAVLFALIAVCLYIKIASPPMGARNDSRGERARGDEREHVIARSAEAPGCPSFWASQSPKGDEAIFLSKNKSRLTILMAASCALALFSREFAVVQPGLILAYHYAYRRRIWWKGFAIISGLTGAYLLLRFTALKFILSGVYYPTTIAERIPGFFAAMTGYLRLLFFPFNLHNEYGHPMFTFSDPRVLAGIALVAFLLAYALLRRKHDPLGTFCIAWFFACIAPVTNMYPPANAYMLEHWLYAPSIGFFLAAARFIAPHLRPVRGTGPTSSTFDLRPFVFIALVLWLGFLTARQNLIYWQDPVVFYSRTLQFNPASKKMTYNLGNAYRERGDKERAIEWYRKSIELDPENEDIYNNLAGVCAESGRFDEAIAVLHRALEINPRMATSYYNLGIVYKDAGRPQEALDAFRQAAAVSPGYVEPYNEIGILLADAQDDARAIQWFEKALQVNPRFAPAYINAAFAYLRQGDPGRAAVCAQQARRLGFISQALDAALNRQPASYP